LPVGPETIRESVLKTIVVHGALDRIDIIGLVFGNTVTDSDTPLVST